jgi:hypothetical protein
MHLVSKLVLAGLGASALAGGAYAADQAIHVMAVPLADGSVMHIRYFGDKKPQIALVPAQQQQQQQQQHIAIPMAYGDPLGIDRMFAEMDAQADAMMRQAAAMAAQQRNTNGKIDAAAVQGMPAGSSVSYSFYSSSNGQGGCTQSVQMTSYGNGAKPKVIEQKSGDCSALDKPVVNAAATAPAKAVPVKAKAAGRKVDPNSI